MQQGSDWFIEQETPYCKSSTQFLGGQRLALNGAPFFQGSTSSPLTEPTRGHLQECLTSVAVFSTASLLGEKTANSLMSCSLVRRALF